MSFIIAIIMGLIIGAVAKFIMPGRDPGGIIVTCLIGIVGSVLATFLGQRLGCMLEARVPASLAASLVQSSC